MLSKDQKTYRDYLMLHFIDCNHDIQRTIIWVSHHFQNMQKYEYNVYQAYRELSSKEKNEVFAELIMLAGVGSDYDATKHKEYV